MLAIDGLRAIGACHDDGAAKVSPSLLKELAKLQSGVALVLMSKPPRLLPQSKLTRLDVRRDLVAERLVRGEALDDQRL